MMKRMMIILRIFHFESRKNMLYHKKKIQLMLCLEENEFYKKEGLVSFFSCFYECFMIKYKRIEKL